MTRLEKIISAANHRYPGVVAKDVRTALLEMDELYSLFMNDVEDSATTYTPPKEVPLSLRTAWPHQPLPGAKARQVKHSGPSPEGMRWQEIRKATRPIGERQAITNRLKAYREQENLGTTALVRQMRELDLKVTYDSCHNWIRGHSLPGDFSCLEIEKFLQAAEVPKCA